MRDVAIEVRIHMRIQLPDVDHDSYDDLQIAAADAARAAVRKHGIPGSREEHRASGWDSVGHVSVSAYEVEQGVWGMSS